MKKLFITLGVFLLIIAIPAYAISTFQVVQGGTGATTLTGWLIGNGTSPFTATTTPFFTRFNFNFATGTSATTTNFFATTASTTNLFTNVFNFRTATGTSATTTSLFSATGDFTSLCISQDCKTAWPSGSSGANPSATVGLSAINGSAGTFLRSDGAPALSQAIAPTWTGSHIFQNATNTAVWLTMLNSTSTSATSTNFFSLNASTTNATSTNLYVANIASTSNLFYGTEIGGDLTSSGMITASSTFASVNKATGVLVDSVNQITGAQNNTVFLNTRNLTLATSSWLWTVRDSGGSTYNVLSINNAITNADGQTTNVGVGTTTPRYRLEVSRNAAPQFALSDSTSFGINHWTFSNINGGLYLATSSPSTFATSTFSALSIDRISGGLNFNTATATNATTTNFAVSGTNIQINTGLDASLLTGTTSPAWNIASSTLDASGKNFSVGTSTFLLKNFPEAMTMNGFYCVASTTGTAIVNFSHDNGNKTQSSTFTTGTYVRTTSNNTWTAFENFNIQASSTSPTTPVNRISCTAVMKKTGI